MQLGSHYTENVLRSRSVETNRRWHSAGLQSQDITSPILAPHDAKRLISFLDEYRTQRLGPITGEAQGDDKLRASYNTSLLIAKTGKPHTIEEDLILPAVKEVITTVVHQPAADIIRKIPLSNSSVQRRIDEMAENNIEETLCNNLQACQYSIQLDESTLSSNETLLLLYV
ncbi:SCAN domain-containing protein 3 [Trichonephila clavipes]|nr:SCAN domain-containing protein 3 [Trichonephila clavipes]